jgi:D-alanyl-D-alanine carboxypeptidase
MKCVGSDGAYSVRNTNKLLRDGPPHAVGKTGYTNRAGHCLASRFSLGGGDLVIVVLGSPDHFGDTRRIFRDAVKKTAGTPRGVRHTTGGPNSPPG